MHYSELPFQLDCVFPLSVAFSKISFYWKLWGWVKKIKTEGFFPKHLTFSFPNVLYCSPESAISSWGFFNSWKHLQQCHHLTWFRLLLICYGLIKVEWNGLFLPMCGSATNWHLVQFVIQDSCVRKSERERGGSLSPSRLASHPRTHHLLARPYNVLCHNYASSFILSKGLTSKVAKSLSLTQCTARVFGHTQQHSRKNKATVIVSPPLAFHYRLMAPLFSALLPLPLYFSLLYIFFLWMGQLDDDGRRDARRRPFWVEAPRRTAAPLSSETWHCPRRPISMLMRK